ADRPTTSRIDLTSLVGDEHTFRYRGRVQRVGPISNDSIVLHCEMELPELTWARSKDDTQTDPEHVGIRWPKVAGEAKKVACINHDVGFVSTNVEPDDGTGTSIFLSDATGFGSTGTGTWGSSVCTWTGKTGNELTGVVQGVAGSPVCNHPIGDIFVEAIEGAVFGVADHEVSAINDVWVKNPYSGSVVRLTTDFTKNTADTIDSETRATLEFTQNELRDALRALAVSPEVTDDGSAAPGGSPVETARVLTDGLAGSGTAKTLGAIADGGYGNADYHELDENQFVHCKFFKPTSGWARQRLNARVNLSSGSGSLSFYAGRYGYGSTLLQTHTLLAGTNTYTTDTTADTKWVSVRITSGGSVTVRLYEVWQLTDNPRTLSQQSGTNGKLTGGSEVGSGNWFDDNDGTSEEIFPTDWAGVKFAAATFDTQRIKVVMEQPDISVKIYVSSSDYGIGGTRIWPATNYEPNSGPDPGTYYFETELQGRYVTIENNSVVGMDLYELSRHTIVYDDTNAMDVAIAGASVGYELRLFADVDGYEVPSGASPAYKAGAAGTLMKKPCDILRYIIEELGGETIDTTTYDACNTNLGATEIACDLRTMGGTWEEIAARVAFESRVTLVPEETSSGRVWKMLTALDTYAFPAASGSVTEWERGGFVEVGRALRDELATRFTYFYAPDWTIGTGEEAYTAILIANEDDNDFDPLPSDANFATAVDNYGSIDAEPFAFRALHDSASAIEVGA
ncbi:MAG: hypothetical protein ACYTAN_17680, partial [Planctomycetota bacterium]